MCKPRLGVFISHRQMSSVMPSVCFVQAFVSTMSLSKIFESSYVVVLGSVVKGFILAAIITVVCFDLLSAVLSSVLSLLFSSTCVVHM